ncbi:hypothetical protein [Bradyrhizobium sp.]|uniref:hypothetical protein n=1 Tax=Bradyrhizobium sp. TaxID=376 RepID=UPI0026212808|nr:hypothetical protein [Bradyrhizobium sp.]
MPLQNRVRPTGEIVAIPERGMFTGNRGIIHDPATRTILRRRWSTHAWIACVLEFRGRRRAVWQRRSWTELFFLDEATSLAAGHRPCFYCRREDAKCFRAAWEKGNRKSDVLAPDMDAVLHRERLASARKLHPLPMPIAKLPDGAMVQAGEESFLIVKGQPLLWTPAGYRAAKGSLKDARLLTPPSTVRAMAAGYRPVLHPSVESWLVVIPGRS